MSVYWCVPLCVTPPLCSPLFMVFLLSFTRSLWFFCFHLLPRSLLIWASFSVSIPDPLEFGCFQWKLVFRPRPPLHFSCFHLLPPSLLIWASSLEFSCFQWKSVFSPHPALHLLQTDLCVFFLTFPTIYVACVFFLQMNGPWWMFLSSFLLPDSLPLPSHCLLCWNLSSTWAITILLFVKPKFHIGSQGWCVEMAWGILVPHYSSRWKHINL
jgi:hypothetical protein